MDRLSPRALRERYRNQVEWFRTERTRLLRKADILSRGQVLDLGTGTGEMLAELRRRTRGEVVGFDLDTGALGLAEKPVIRGDAAVLPFGDGAFDLIFTQMFFLWICDPEDVIAEIHRALRPGCYLVVAAEPDYDGLVTFPNTSEELASFIAGIEEEGADMRIGRKLGGLLTAAGFTAEAGTHPCNPLTDDGSGFAYIPYFWFLAKREGP